MKELRRSIALAAVAIALAITVAACGGESGGGKSGGGQKTEYTNAQYGFTLTYGEPLSVVTLTPSGGEEYAIAFGDKDGPLVDDQYANGLRVSVVGMDQAIKAKDVPKLQKAIQQAIEKMVAARAQRHARLLGGLPVHQGWRTAHLQALHPHQGQERVRPHDASRGRGLGLPEGDAGGDRPDVHAGLKRAALSQLS